MSAGNPDTDPVQRLAALGLTLPEVTAPLAAYVPAVRTGRYVYTAGQLPVSEGKLLAELSTWSVPVKREYVDSSVRMTLRVPSRALYKLEKFRIESKVNSRGRKRSGPAAE